MLFYSFIYTYQRGISAAGSAPHWQCGGQGFKSPMLHHHAPIRTRRRGHDHRDAGRVRADGAAAGLRITAGNKKRPARDFSRAGLVVYGPFWALLGGFFCGRVFPPFELLALLRAPGRLWGRFIRPREVSRSTGSSSLGRPARSWCSARRRSLRRSARAH